MLMTRSLPLPVLTSPRLTPSPQRSTTGAGAKSGNHSSCQFRQLVEQPFRVLQIGGVQAFVELLVDLGQQCPCLCQLALALIKPGRATRGSKLPGLSLLLASNLE